MTNGEIDLNLNNYPVGVIMNKSIMVLCVLACITLLGCSLYKHDDCTFEGVNISMLKVGDHS